MFEAMLAFVGVILLLVFAYLWNRRELKRDREEYEAWWESYREREWRELASMATRHEFPRDPDETDEEYGYRFKAWIHGRRAVRS